MELEKLLKPYGIIYCVTNLRNYKKYVGQTKRTLAKRKMQHERLAKNDVGFYLHSAMNKYGFDNFAWEIIDVSDDKNELDALEKYWIRELDTFGSNGYNLTKGGAGGGASLVGEKNPQAKITDKQALEIGTLISETDIKYSEIAKMMKTSIVIVKGIACGDAWSFLFDEIPYVKRLKKLGKSSSRQSISDEVVLKIIELIENSDLSLSKIANELGVGLNIVKHISRGNNYKHMYVIPPGKIRAEKLKKKQNNEGVA